jgi:prophage tail gpP-like protein
MVWPPGESPRRFPPDEIATLVVDGREYRNWKSVRVNMEHGRAYQEFQFTAAEPVDIHTGDALSGWRVRPGMDCAVLLGGVMAIQGKIEIREGAYNDKEHGVMFYGRSWGATGADASVHKEVADQQSGTYTSITSAALAGTGVNLVAPGDNGVVHPNFSISKGETPWMVSERLARFVPGLRVSDDGFGTWHAVRVNNLQDGEYTFLEGNNILEARGTIDVTHRAGVVESIGNPVVNDSVSSHGARELFSKAVDGTVEPSRYVLAVVEEPATQALVDARARQEIAFRMEAIVHATVTVYGWFTRPGELFQMYHKYHINSPMLGLDRWLWSRVVTFEQSDAKGTTTTVELCTPESLTGLIETPEVSASTGPSSEGNWVGQGVLPNDLEFRPGERQTP